MPNFQSRDCIGRSTELLMTFFPFAWIKVVESDSAAPVVTDILDQPRHFERNQWRTPCCTEHTQK